MPTITYEIALAYDEYCVDCYYKGIRHPLSIWEWLDREWN